MARKNSFSFKVASAQSMATSFVTPATVIRNLDNDAYQINITTTNSVGTFSVEASLDYTIDETTGHVSNAGNWVTLNLAGGSPSAAAANDSILIDLNQLSFEAIRLRYTSSVAGTGVCDVYVFCRQLGG